MKALTVVLNDVACGSYMRLNKKTTMDLIVFVNIKYWFCQIWHLTFLIILSDQHIAILERVQYCFKTEEE